MKICFLYGGQGSQKKGMGKDFFYDNYPVFKDFYDGINLHFDLKEYSFEKSDEEIAQTQYTQPIMVGFQIGLTKILKQKNIKPDIVGGLSIGEYSAFYASGILSDKDAMARRSLRAPWPSARAAGSGKGRSCAPVVYRPRTPLLPPTFVTSPTLRRH